MIGLFVKAQEIKFLAVSIKSSGLPKPEADRNRPYNKNCSNSQYHSHHSSGNMSGVTIEIS